MSELIAKRLRGLQAGTALTLTWLSGAEHVTASGVVTDNDGSTCVALETTEGEEVFVAYEAVRSLRIPKGVPAPGAAQNGQPQPESAPQYPAPGTGAVPPAASQMNPAPVGAESAGYGGAAAQGPSDKWALPADMPALSDRELKQLFNRLPKKDRKKLNGSYDSFQFGVKCTDRGKMTAAAESAAKILLDGYANGYAWDRSASRFCGALFRRTGQNRPEVYLAGKWYWEAAWCAYKENNLTEAGVCAVLGLLEPDWRRGEDLMTILVYSGAQARDISGLAFLQERIPERMAPELPGAVHTLAAAAGLRVTGQEAPAVLGALRALWPSNAVAEEVRRRLREEGGAVPASGSAAPTGESAPAPAAGKYIGWISAYNPLEQQGRLAGENLDAEFRYPDAAGWELKKILENWNNSGARTPAVWIEATLRAGRVFTVTLSQSPLVLAKRLADEGRYGEAMEQCMDALPSPDAPDALTEIIRYALDWNKGDPRPRALESAAETYEAHVEDYPRDAWHAAMLGQLYYELGDLRAAVDFMRESLSFPHLSAKLRVTFLAHCMRYSVKCYNQSGDLELMESVREMAEEWLSLFVNGPLANDLHCQRYYPRILRWKCRAACELSLPDEAEKDYLALLHAFPHDADLPYLKEYLRRAWEERAEKEKEQAKEKETKQAKENPPEPKQPEKLSGTERQEKPSEQEKPKPEPEPEKQPETDSPAGEQLSMDNIVRAAGTGTPTPTPAPSGTAEPLRAAEADAVEASDAEPETGNASEEAEPETGDVSEDGGGTETKPAQTAETDTDEDDDGEEPPSGGEKESPSHDTPADTETEDDAPDTEEAAADAAPVYEDRDGWDALHMTKEDAAAQVLGMRREEDIPAALCFLKAGSALNPDLLPLYRTAALAARDPLAETDYSLASLLSAMESGDTAYPEFSDRCMAAAFLRASFRAGRDYGYNAKALRDSLSAPRDFPALSEVLDLLEEFRAGAGCGIDACAGYHSRHVDELRAEQEDIVRQAGELYEKYIQALPRDSSRFKRLVETKKLLFAHDGTLADLLRMVQERDAEGLAAQKAVVSETFLNGSTRFTAKQISVVQVDRLIGECWEEAAKALQTRRSASTLQGSRRNNLRSAISEILGVVCRWYALEEKSGGATGITEEGEALYRRLAPALTEKLTALAAACADAAQSESDAAPLGAALIAAAARELAARLDGSWRPGQEAEFYAPLLKTDHILLDEDLLPDLSATFCALPRFNVFARIRDYVEAEKPDWPDRLKQIYGPDRAHNNYGTAARIAAYLRLTGREEQAALPRNAKRFAEQSAKQAEMAFQSFLERYALAKNRGQIQRTDAFGTTLEATVEYWYSVCAASGNFGFFFTLLEHAEAQIHAAAARYGQQLEGQLAALLDSDPARFADHPEYEEAIRERIAQQNFLVAEDWMHRIRLGDFSLDVTRPEALEYLDDFQRRYADLYRRVANTSRTLAKLLDIRTHNKDTRGARRLIENWLTGSGGDISERIAQFLALLGWRNAQVEAVPTSPDGKTELYRVTRSPVAEFQTAPLHPIAAFGSQAAREGMYAVCLYGVYDCDRLFEKIRTLDALDGNKLILLDYALSAADRRALARKMKQRESGLRNVYLVIDRVLVCYLSDVYNENLIQRILMAAAMPFSYCQPYVAESSHSMPPEMFIGRKEELLKIEQPDGVNLLYGGRQLGKSALFQKAKGDLDGNQRRRAVLVDVKDCGCAVSARRLSTELTEVGLLPEDAVTEDWETLCGAIRRRLRGSDDIRYLLVMLDEADTFIADCANDSYRPLAALKDIQQTLPGRFKFVLAGLHNVVRFNRESALGGNSVIPQLPSLKITPFRTPEAQELLTEPLSYLGLSLPDKATVTQILATANYFPGLIQLYCQKLIQSLREPDYAGYDVKTSPPYVVSEAHLRRVMADREFVEQIREKFEITLRLDQDQGGIYYPLALLIGWMYSVEPSERGYSAADVCRQAQDLNIRGLRDLDEEKLAALLRELQDLNILRGVESDTWLLASRNFRDLLGSDEEIFNQLVKYGEAAQ